MVMEPTSSADSTHSARQTGSALPVFMMYSTLNTTMAIVHELKRMKTLTFGLTGARKFPHSPPACMISSQSSAVVSEVAKTRKHARRTMAAICCALSDVWDDPRRPGSDQFLQGCRFSLPSSSWMVE